MDDLNPLLHRLHELLVELEHLDETAREPVLAFLDGLEHVHRTALGRLGGELGPEVVERLRAADPAIAWLLDAYGVGVDEGAEVDAALATVRPYIESHGGTLEVLSVAEGVVRVRMAGSCAGCSASAVTLRDGVEKALHEGFPGFRGLEVEELAAEPHPPPGGPLLQIESWRG